MKESPTSRKWQAQISSGFDALVALASSELDRSKQIRRQSATSPDGPHGGSKSPGSNFGKAADNAQNHRGKEGLSGGERPGTMGGTAPMGMMRGQRDLSHTFNAAFSKSLTSMQILSNAAEQSSFDEDNSSSMMSKNSHEDEVRIDVEEMDWANEDMQAPRTPGRTDPEEDEMEMEKKLEKHAAPPPTAPPPAAPPPAAPPAAVPPVTAPNRNLPPPVTAPNRNLPPPVTAPNRNLPPPVTAPNINLPPPVTASNINLPPPVTAPNRNLPPPVTAPNRNLHISLSKPQFSAVIKPPLGPPVVTSNSSVAVSPQKPSVSIKDPNFLTLTPPDNKPVQSPIDQVDIQQFHKKFSRKEGRKFDKHYALVQQQHNALVQQQHQQLHNRALEQHMALAHSLHTMSATPNVVAGYINLQKGNVLPPSTSQGVMTGGAPGNKVKRSVGRPKKRDMAQQQQQQRGRSVGSKSSTVLSSNTKDLPSSNSSGSMYPYIELKSSHKPTYGSAQQQQQQGTKQQVSPGINPKSGTPVSTSVVQQYGSTPQQQQQQQQRVYAMTQGAQQPIQQPPGISYHARNTLSPQQGSFGHPGQQQQQALSPVGQFRTPYPSSTPSPRGPSSTPSPRGPSSTPSPRGPSSTPSPRGPSSTPSPRGVATTTPPLRSPPTTTASKAKGKRQPTPPPIPSRMAMRPGMPTNPTYQPVFTPSQYVMPTRPDLAAVPAYIHSAPYPPSQSGVAYRNAAAAPTPGYIMQFPR